MERRMTPTIVNEEIKNENDEAKMPEIMVSNVDKQSSIV
jgi:hypothetical protein